jgi:transposase-like protein
MINRTPRVLAHRLSRLLPSAEPDPDSAPRVRTAPGRRKITDDLRRRVLLMAAAGATRKRIAARFGISRSSVFKILRESSDDNHP